MDTQTEPLWDAAEAASYLKISKANLYARVQKNEIPHLRLGTTKNAPVRFRRSELDAWMEGQ